MGSNTTNYNLYKPDVGETGWGAAVNTSTDTVDTQMKSNADDAAAAVAHATTDGTSHANVVLNDTHRASDGKDHSDVVTNNAKISYTDAADVGLNTTHRGSDGKDHSDVVTNNAKISYTDAADVSSNTTHRGSDGKDHSDVVLNNTHRSSSGSDHSLVNSSLVSTINFIIDGGGAAVTTGIKGDIEIPFACTISQVTLLADQSTTTTIDIWKDAYANFPPTDADSITAAAVPGITAGLKDQDATLTAWTTSITAGDILRFNVDANDNAERVTLSLKVTKT